MATKSSRMAFTLGRIVSFLKIFLRNGRATFGLGIILFFAFIALAAPLLTPYNSLGLDPNRSGALAGRAVAPSWFRQLPQILGGNPDLSENMDPVPDPSLPRLWADGGQLNYSIVPVNASGDFDVQSVLDVNYPHIIPGFDFPNKNGSLATTFQRLAGNSTGETVAYIFRDFDWPYGGTISMYNGNFDLLVKGSVKEVHNPLEQWFIVAIMGQSTREIAGNLTLLVSNPSGIHLALTADAGEYFDELSATPRANQKWVDQGYTTWQSWLDGAVLANGTKLTNGTILSSDVVLPGHWNEMNWIVSSGSLTSRNYTQLQNSTYAWMYSDTGNVSYTGFRNNLEICDSNLTVAGNEPDIVQIANWTRLEARTVNESLAGSSRLYLNIRPLNRSWPTTLYDYRTVYYTIGSNETEEVVQYNGYEENVLKIKQPLQYNHPANETVIVRAATITLEENVYLPRNRNRFLLLKVSLEDPYEVYKIQVNRAGGIGYGNVILYDVSSMKYNRLRVTGTETRLHVPVKVRVFLGRAVGNASLIELTRVLFPVAGGNYPYGFHTNATTGETSIDRPESGLETTQGWVISRTSWKAEISYIYNSDQQFLSDLLSSKGTYRYALELTFVDEGDENGTVFTTVYLDDFAIKLYGRAFGAMGSDQYGRDLFAQLIYGTRISLYLGLLVAVISVSIGLTVGLVAGYLGGAADQFLMRFNDLLLVLPGLPLMIVIVAVLGARIENLIVLLGFLGWNGFARLVRSQVLSLKERPFIEAAKAAGAGTGHIVLRHVLPHVMALVYVSLATAVPGAITAEAALSWLGFFDPTRMSWGRMLHEVFVAGATRNWWWVIPPGLAISLVAVAFILLGFALDEILNPKLRLRK